MPRYHFDVHDGREAHDDKGTDLPDVEAARAQAIEIAGAFTKKPGMIEEGGGAVVVNVRDESGGKALEVRLVFTISGG